MIPRTIELEEFTNREDELNVVYPKLDEIQKDRPYLFGFILRFVGIPGIGKTTLLKEIEKEAKVRNIKTAYVQCNRSKELYLLDELSVQLFGTAKKSELFIEDLKSMLSETPAVFLIDDTHYIDELNQGILEDILDNVYQINRLLLILAGRSDLRWKKFELRRRTGKVVLEQFGEKEARNWIKDADFSDQIYPITRGYPLAIVKACDWINLHADSADPDQLKEHEMDLVFELVNQILIQYILVDIPHERQHELIFLLKNLSPLRRFNENILSDFLPELDNKKRDTLAARMLIRKMSVETYLVKWDSARMAYALNYLIRRLLSLEMKFNNKESLTKIHKFMMKWYGDSIKKALERDPSAPQTVLYLIEYIYHLAQYKHTNGLVEGIQNEIEQKVFEVFRGYKDTEKDHFYQELKKDDEIDEILGNDFEQLVNFVEQNRG
jgi:hypothetical protein